LSIQYFDVKRRLFQKFDIYDYIGATFWNLIVTFSDALQFVFIIFVLGLPDVKNMKDCVDWKREGFTTDGVYTITPESYNVQGSQTLESKTTGATSGAATGFFSGVHEFISRI
jgi:hypothetical protein